MTTPSRSVSAQAAEAILHAFVEIPYPTRTELGHAMRATRTSDEYGFLDLLGLHLSHYGTFPHESPTVRRYLTAAVAETVDSGEAPGVIASLGADEPWATVARALSFAMQGPVTDEDRDPFGVTDPRVSV